MKTTIILTLISAHCLLVSAQTPTAVTDIHIAVSPFLDQAARLKVRQALIQFVLAAAPGSRIACDDGYNLQTVASFDIPRLRFDSAANRARALAQPLAALGRWFAATNGLPSPELAGSAALKVPEYVDAIAGQGTGGGRTVILIGSPFAIYGNEPSFSMTDLRVPSDGHLLANLQASPYGTAERTNRLANTTVYWCYLSESIWGNELHHTLVRRFWTAFVQALGGRMANFSGDLQAALAPRSSPTLVPVETVRIDPIDTKLEMRVARPRQIPTWLPIAPSQTKRIKIEDGTAVGAGHTSVPSAPTVQAAAQPGRPAPAAAAPARDLASPILSPVNIGIMWESSDAYLDLDLYVKAHPGAADLYFARSRTPEGEHVYDWRQPNARADFEWVRLKPPVRLDQVSAWVNLYRGRGPISGTVTVHFENSTYTGSFQINAPYGNAGGDLTQRDRSQYWTRLDLLQIIRRTESHR